MPKNDITEVREHLFSALRGLTDKDAPMEIERAKAVADVAQTIINSAKVEVDFLKISGGNGSGFIPSDTLTLPATPANDGSLAGQLGVTVRQHKLRG
jgi:hypothetical protein